MAWGLYRDGSGDPFLNARPYQEEVKAVTCRV